MAGYMELIPAYGRDYKTAKEVKAAFAADKDFEGDYTIGFKLINRPQVPKGTTVNLRYRGHTMIAQVKV